MIEGLEGEMIVGEFDGGVNESPCGNGDIRNMLWWKVDRHLDRQKGFCNSVGSHLSVVVPREIEKVLGSGKQLNILVNLKICDSSDPKNYHCQTAFLSAAEPRGGLNIEIT